MYKMLILFKKQLTEQILWDMVAPKSIGKEKKKSNCKPWAPCKIQYAITHKPPLLVGGGYFF